jgi:hypothetical protein
MGAFTSCASGKNNDMIAEEDTKSTYLLEAKPHSPSSHSEMSIITDSERSYSIPKLAHQKCLNSAGLKSLQTSSSDHVYIHFDSDFILEDESELFPCFVEYKARSVSPKEVVNESTSGVYLRS